MSASPETDLVDLGVTVPRQPAREEAAAPTVPGTGDRAAQEHDWLIDVDAAEARVSPVAVDIGPVPPDLAPPDLAPPELVLPGLGPVGPAGPAADPRALLRRYRRWALSLDAAAALVALTIAVNLRFPAGPGGYVLVPVLAPLAWVTAVAAYRTYEPRYLGSGPDEFRRVLHAGLLLFTIIAVTSYSAGEDFSRGIVLAGIAATVTASLLARQVLRLRLHRARARGRGMHRVLVVGRADAAVGLIEQLVRMPSHGYVPVGVCVPGEVRPSHVREVPVVGDVDGILSAVDALGAHVVAVASHPDVSGQALRRLSWALAERGVELIVSPGIVAVAGPRLSIRPVSELSLLHLERPAAAGGWLKSVFDRTVAAALLLVASPLMLGIAAAIRLSSPGPALFRQVRVGAGGRQFTMYKFRSMVVDADRRKAELSALDEGNGVLFKVRDDPRVTRIGAFLRRRSLDEVPQLINVVRGEMSLVGPRPPLPAEVAGYCDDAVRRLRVRPGMTGLWQVSGRSDLSWEESLRLDLRYVDNWSLTYDLQILWRTVRAVLGGSGAY
jgi:exopolysaccharide biosynthesis polyprenyl glycosylphosphotransferase